MNTEEFYQQVKRVIEDKRLYPFAQAVMIAYFVYDGDRSRVWAAFPQQNEQSMNLVERDLMRHDWLASPEG